MKRTLWFIVPAHGRLEIAAVCLRQLRRTCDALLERDIEASAVVIADDENLDLAQELDFHGIERDNRALGRKINDGYQLAGQERIEFMVPCGSDDWIHPDFVRLPHQTETVATHLSTVVSEDCSRLAMLDIPYGDGVRIYTRATLQTRGFRPAEEDRRRAIDTTTHRGVGAAARMVWHDVNPLYIVDFKSRNNLNDYDGCARTYGASYTRRYQEPYEVTDVWARLGELYPADAVRDMQAIHEGALV